MRRLGVIALVLALVGGVVAYLATRDNGDGSPHRQPVAPPTREVNAYLDAWAKRDYATMRALSYQTPAAAAVQTATVFSSLGVTNAAFTPRRVTLVPGNDVHANATFTAKLVLRGFGTWGYSSTLSLVRVVTTPNGTVTPATNGEPGGQWKVIWRLASVHPALRAGVTLRTTRSWSTRGAILDANGTVLVGTGEVVDIGVEPGRIKDKTQVATALQQQLGVTPAQLDADLRGAQPDWFVPVATLPRDSHYQAVRAVLLPIPGILFRAHSGRTGPSDTFARQVLGHTHEVTADELKTLGARYQTGDIVGVGGIEQAYERRLAGTPSATVQVVDTRTHKVLNVLARVKGSAGASVQSTLDPRIQNAAQAALVGVAQPAALVAIDIPSGEVRGAANNPPTGFNRAFTGHYAPGSTFKVVTATAALNAGMTAGTTITCPPSITVQGRTLHNFESETLGTITFRSAFAASCNTAFVQLAQRAGKTAVENAARTYGFNIAYKTGLPSFGGSYPAPRDNEELAESAFGQGRVDVSPVHMASVAATVARGSWKPPVVVRGVIQPAGVAVGALTAGVDATLKDFMLAVLQRGGTAAGVSVAGKTIYGKTGTAEFGGSSNKATHAWFIGFSGNTAFAVIVEGGGVGGRVAAPIAARFVAALP